MKEYENNRFYKCKKCGGKMKPGKALMNKLVHASDFGGDTGHNGTTGSYSGKAIMIAVLKCLKCGNSYVQGKNEKTSSRKKA